MTGSYNLWLISFLIQKSFRNSSGAGANIRAAAVEDEDAEGFGKFRRAGTGGRSWCCSGNAGTGRSWWCGSWCTCSCLCAGILFSSRPRLSCRDARSVEMDDWCPHSTTTTHTKRYICNGFFDSILFLDLPWLAASSFSLFLLFILSNQLGFTLKSPTNTNTRSLSSILQQAQRTKHKAPTTEERVTPVTCMWMRQRRKYDVCVWDKERPVPDHKLTLLDNGFSVEFLFWINVHQWVSTLIGKWVQSLDQSAINFLN